MKHLAYLFLALISIPAAAQVEQASVTGAVTDPSGAAVAAPGEHEATIERTGFKKASVGGIALTVGLTATVSVQLEVGAVQTEVRVEAQAVQLERQSASLGNVVSSRQLIELGLRLSY
jgi:hypothetical protein